MAAIATLAATWTHQFTADQQVFQQCVANANGSESDDLKLGARNLRRMMLIQEAILISIFFAGVLSVIVAKRIARASQHSIP